MPEHLRASKARVFPQGFQGVYVVVLASVIICSVASCNMFHYMGYYITSNIDIRNGVVGVGGGGGGGDVRRRVRA